MPGLCCWALPTGQPALDEMQKRIDAGSAHVLVLAQIPGRIEKRRQGVTLTDGKAAVALSELGAPERETAKARRQIVVIDQVAIEQHGEILARRSGALIGGRRSAVVVGRSVSRARLEARGCCAVGFER